MYKLEQTIGNESTIYKVHLERYWKARKNSNGPNIYSAVDIPKIIGI